VARLSEVEGSDDGDGSKVTMGNGNGMLQILEIGRMLGTYSKMLSAETACSGVDWTACSAELETGSCCWGRLVVVVDEEAWVR
jgi:hypothetical protein